MGILEDMQKASMFFTGGAGAPTGGATAADMRRKIALAMMMKNKPFPKTFGEGLAAIGAAIGDRSLASRLEREAGQQAAAENSMIKGMDPAATGPRAEADTPLATQVAAAAAADSPAPAANMADPLPVQTGAATAPSPVAGFRPPPAYLAPHLAASGLSPERQAYLGHLAGKEARSANEVSPTGAAGPFQFIRSTGRQYGLMGPDGDRRTDPVASIAAVNRLTDDNAAVLTKALGRPPSPGELALAHQQGAGTAAKMLTGAGNAPDYNLRVNNAGGLSGQAAANKIMGYYGMPGSGAAPPPGSRDSIAALTAQTPPTQGDMAQEARLSDVVGMTRAPPSFGATAALGGRAGDIQSDMPPVTGGLQGPLGQAVGDTVQQRQDTLGPQPAPPPVPPAGPGATAQAGPGVFPPVTSDGGPPKAIIPGGGLPPPIAPQISQAPPDPRAAIRTVPTVEEYKPRNRPQPEPPAAPGMGPIEREYTQKYLNADVSDRVKAAAAAHIAAERARLAIPYNNAMKKYEADIAVWKTEQQQDREYEQKQAATVLANEKARRELEGEGATALTPEQRKQYGISDSQAAYMTRRGEIKFGPAGTNVSVNTGEKANQKLAEKLDESFIKAFEEGNTAGDDIKQLGEMRALAARVGTGAGAVVKQYLGQWGIKTEGLSEIEALNAGISRIIPQQRVPGSGTSSDFDGQLFKGAVVGLSKTPEGNNLIFDTMEGLAQNKLARAEVAGRVVSGEITRQEGVKEMLGLQRQARDLSDKVKAHLETTGQSKTVNPAVPSEVTESAAEKWARDPANASNPKARIILEDLARRRGSQ